MNLIIAIVGRPNVGKSTLFNYLTKTKDALVANFSGLTRDRQYGIAKGFRKSFTVIDTGGFEPLVDNGIMYQMANQAKEAIIESDAVIFVVDGRLGLTPQDKVILQQLRTLQKPLYVAVNKVEGMDKTVALSEFYELGVSTLFPLSSSHGDGVYNLINNILKNTEEVDSEQVESTDILENSAIKFAIVGRPNVGKSTLVNAILGEERVITFNEAGTTRDSIYINFEKDNKEYVIIDTAGMRRRTKIENKIEKFSVIKTLKAINEAHVVVLVLDASLDIADQDAIIIGHALEAGKAIVVAINKWDSLDQSHREQLKIEVKQKLHFLDFAKFVYISAFYKRGINEVINNINEAYTAAYIKLPTSKLTRVLIESVNRQAPSFKGNFRPKLRYAHQGGSNPPLIVIHGNSLDKISKSYTKYLERSFRKAFILTGTPLKIEYKTSTNPYES